MAIDKKRTKAGTKIMIWAIVAAFLLLGVAQAISSFTSGSPGATGTATASTTAVLDQIGQSKRPAIQADEQQLASKPKDYTILKRLGDEYFDWADAVKRAAPSAGVDVTIWARSADYYKRALAVKPGDPNVQTDMSIALYSSGDLKGAIAAVEAVRKKDAKFSPAIFNSGIFYASDNQPGKAVQAFQDYLKVDPNGPNAPQAKQYISQLQSSAATGSAPSTSGQ